MPLNNETKKPSFEEFMAQPLPEHLQANVDAVEKAHQKSLFTSSYETVGSIATGAGRGVGNMGADLFDTLTDAGFIAGLSTRNMFDEDLDINKAYKMLQKDRDKLTSYIRSEESDDKIANFTMNAVESIGKYAFFFKSLSKLGVSKTTKIIAAGGLEGATNDPDRELIGLDKMLKATVGLVAPDRVTDLEKAMDPNTDPSIAKDLIRRVMSGVEIGALSAAGEKVFDAAAPIVKAGASSVSKGIGEAVETAGKHLPEEFKAPIVRSFGQLMMQARAAKDYIKNGKKGTFEDAVRTFEQGEVKITYNKGAINPEASPSENLRQSVTINHSIDTSVNNATDYTRAVGDYEKKLEELAPQIYGDVVKMAKSRGVAEEGELYKYAKALGIKEADQLTEEKFKEALKAQAHNLLYEQQMTKFILADSNLQKGIITEEDFLKAAKGFHTTILQRDALLSKAGTTLRIGQELPEGIKRSQKQIKKNVAQSDAIRQAYGRVIDDPESLKVFSQSMANTLRAANLKGDTIEEIQKSFTKALNKADPAKTNKDIAKEVADAFATSYQANLLSGVPTLMQNTLGSFTQLNMQVADTMFRAGISRTVGRKAGDPTFTEAAIQFKGVWENHLTAVYLAAKSAKEALTGGTKSSFMKSVSNLPEMEMAQRESMFRMRKPDMSSNRNNTVNDYIDQSPALRVFAARPIMDFIAGQDAVTKMAGARAYLNGRWDTALYVDDIFKLAENASNPVEAQKIMNNLFRSGRDVLTPEEIAKGGFKSPEALSMQLASWRANVSEGASDWAVRGAMQQPLGAGFKSLQKATQGIPYGGKFIFPFFQTPANIIDDALQRMPVIPIGEAGTLGIPIHPRFYADFMAGGERRQEAVAKALTGNAIAFLGYNLAKEGKLTAIPHDNKDAATLSQTLQIPPGSIAVGDQNYIISTLGPAGVLMNVGALAYHFENQIGQKASHMSDEELNKFSDNVLFNVASVMEVMREQPFMTGFDTIIDWLETDPTDESRVQKLQEQFAQIAGNLVPYSSAQRQLSQIVMDESKRANGLLETFMQQFYPYENHTAYDIMGNPIKTDARYLLRGTTQKQKDIEMLIYKYTSENFDFRPAKFEQLYYEAGKPAVKIRLEKNMWDDYHKFLKQQNIEERLSAIVFNPSFVYNAENGMVERNDKNVGGVITSARKAALQKVIDKYPDLRADAVKKQREKEIDNLMIRTAPATQGNGIPTFNNQ
jgi:hypothetical protein